MAKVSIIIPCFNAGAALGEAVQSALAQTLRDSEIVIVDDGSTDAETLALLGTLPGPHTRVLRQDHAGPAAARNRGIDAATGEYILPLDADDTIEPEYARLAAAVLDGQPDVGIVYSRATRFGAENGPWELPDFSPDELALGNVIFVSAMFRKADWRAVGGFGEMLTHGMEDYDFWIRLVHRGCRVVRLDSPLFHCRIGAQSRTAAFERDRDQVVATYAEILRRNRDFFAEHAESLYRRHFALLAEVSRLTERLEAESRAAAADRAATLAAKAEADRYNAGLLAAKAEADRYNASLIAAKAEADRYNASLESELDRARARYVRMQRRFRLLKPLWPAEDRDGRKPR